MIGDLASEINRWMFFNVVNYEENGSKWYVEFVLTLDGVKVHDTSILRLVSLMRTLRVFGEDVDLKVLPEKREGEWFTVELSSSVVKPEKVASVLYQGRI